ncbi:MAG: type III polyketide synthase [Rhodanobacteraceae bacterium]|nr:MAG: type III polyketide synthase [Rhodanobacteraceae bacterium]
MTPAAIIGIGAAVPVATFGQDMAIPLAMARCCSNEGERAWLQRIYSSCGVQRRGSVLLAHDDDAASIESFYPPRLSESDAGPTTAVRLARYTQESGELATRACAAALTDAAIHPTCITHVVIVSCTGLFSPGLDAELVERFGLARGVGRVNIGFMGCHGAFNGLRVAAALAHSAPDARVLLCCVELCSLHFAYGFNRQRVVANALFADGAAAVVLAPGGKSALHLQDTASLLTRDSAGAMTWRIGDHGFEMGLTLEVPQRIRASLREWLEPWLASRNLRIGDVAHWAIHPGGPEIVQATTDALGIGTEAGDVSRAILAEHGNMSSPTVLFILQRMRLRNASGPIVALGFGPGLVFEAALLD